MEGKPFISPSQLDSYTRCGEAYRRRYLLNERRPSSVAAQRGTAVHAGGEYDLEQKIETGVDLKTSDIVDKSVSVFEGSIKNEGYSLSPDEVSRGARVVIGEEKDNVVSLSELMAQKALPLIRPAAVEVSHRIVLGGPYDLMGRLDVETVEGDLTDFKTSGSRWTQAEVDEDDQFTFYWLTYNVLRKRPPRSFIMDNLVSTKKPQHIRLVTRRTEADMDALLNRVNTMVDGLKKGVFMPATRGSWWCSKKWCNYWETCPYVNGRKETVIYGNGTSGPDVVAGGEGGAGPVPGTSGGAVHQGAGLGEEAGGQKPGGRGPNHVCPF